MNRAGLPLAIKVPQFVAALMILLGAVASERVLSRFTAMQERHLRDLAALYFHGLSVAILPAALRDDVWEAFDALDRAARREGSLSARVTTFVTEGGVVLASSDPLRFPTGAAMALDVAAVPTPERLSLGSDPTLSVRSPIV
jgi:hypothetical protein